MFEYERFWYFLRNWYLVVYIEFWDIESNVWIIDIEKVNNFGKNLIEVVFIIICWCI